MGEIMHRIVIDEHECFDSGYPIFRAYCTDECGWQGEAWWHACDYADNEDTEQHPVDAAAAAAEEEGARHLIELRLEYLRGELLAERISYGELAELQSLAEYIDPGDVDLLEAAGVPEFPNNEED